MDQKDIDIPEELRRTIVGTFREEGEKWLAELPSIIRRYAKEWKFSVHAPISERYLFHYIAPVTLESGEKAMLKIGMRQNVPCSEMQALTAFAAKKIVRLLKSSQKDHVLLLEFVEPGTLLEDIRKKDDEEATRIAATFIRDIPSPIPSGIHFQSVADWASEMQPLEGMGGSPEEIGMFKKAKDIFQELEQSKTEDKLLHGDLHYSNILYSKAKGWVVIDPKGVTGDPTYEPARLLHNPVTILLSKEILEKRIEILASTLQASKERIIKWAYFDCMLSSYWIIREHDYHPKNIIACAKILEEILHSF